jgi:hypothetical protein
MAPVVWGILALRPCRPDPASMPQDRLALLSQLFAVSVLPEFLMISWEDLAKAGVPSTGCRAHCLHYVLSHRFCHLKISLVSVSSTNPW